VWIQSDKQSSVIRTSAPFLGYGILAITDQLPMRIPLMCVGTSIKFRIGLVRELSPRRNTIFALLNNKGENKLAWKR
jgi:hypothetical protein